MATTNYPGSLDAYPVPNNGDTISVADHWLGPAVIGIETELGTDPAGYATDVKTRLNDINPSQHNLKADTITESQTSTGVTIEGIKHEDTRLFIGTSDTSHFHTGGNGAIIRSGQVGSNLSQAPLRLEGSGADFYALSLECGSNSWGIISIASSPTDQLSFGYFNGSTNVYSLTLYETGAVYCSSLSKGSGSFKIDHPLKPETHHLVHSFIEGPKADLIYSGMVQLKNGYAEVNIDADSGMTEGTFEALCREVRRFVSNESGYDPVKSRIEGNKIIIECQNENSNDEVFWHVIGERKDRHMFDTHWTDENGRVIVEPEKEQAS